MCCLCRVHDAMGAETRGETAQPQRSRLPRVGRLGVTQGRYMRAGALEKRDAKVVDEFG